VFPRGNARSVALDGKMKAGKGRAA
jgi:hypothetical protein